MAESLQVSDLSVALGGRSIVEGLDFDVDAGSVTALLGPNGAGKTTILRALAGLLRYGGAVRFGGRELGELSPRERARLIAYVPQQSMLDAPLAVREVVEQGRYCHHSGWSRLGRDDREAVAEAIAATDVEALVERRFTELSGGEKRRVLLSRALATRAPVVALDEPTASLDIAHALELFETLRRLATDGRCVLVVLHDVRDALSACDQALLLAGGRLVGRGAPVRVLDAAALLRVYGVELVEARAPVFRLPRAAPEEP